MDVMATHFQAFEWRATNTRATIIHVKYKSWATSLFVLWCCKRGYCLPQKYNTGLSNPLQNPRRPPADPSSFTTQSTETQHHSKKAQAKKIRNPISRIVTHISSIIQALSIPFQTRKGEREGRKQFSLPPPPQTESKGGIYITTLGTTKWDR